MTIWQQPDLKAITERNSHGDSCAPIAILDYLRLGNTSYPATNAEVNVIRQQCINAGLMNVGSEAGMTIAQIDAALRRLYGVTPVFTQVYREPLDLTAFRSRLDAAMAARQCVIMETAVASKLPGNQANVNYHFILIGGTDGAGRYWCCNGDTLTALANGDWVSPVWYSWPQLAASVPCGYIILPARGNGGTAMAGVPANWTDNGSQLKAPNGGIVEHGFRAYILANGWDSADVPITGEFTIDPLLLQDGRWHSGPVQAFLYTVLMWAESVDAALGVANNRAYRMPVGKEWKLYRDNYLALKNAPAPVPPAPPPTPPAPTLSSVEQAALDFAKAIEKLPQPTP